MNLNISGAVPLLPAAFVAWCLIRIAVALSVPFTEHCTHTDNADWLCRLSSKGLSIAVHFIGHCEVTATA